ncbi:uncharacterized protein LOC117121534 [Anneissia japonica]|uniref:uncharacterized protein LOC117121534 n=1 Tax=Anneissia japonica TaxID=1529436 RepID=UPI001425B85B|nr:uncharacterized protein LOC117121534 [Anneissia japonica]XP_033122655.1 uncharacterized protein LOC117121534 [Anneissia japonica]
MAAAKVKQRYVVLHHPDFENFDNEMSVEDYQYYTKHKDEFMQMWNEQPLIFWKRLNLNYKGFLVDYGTVYKLRASGPLMDMLLKECWGYIDRQTTKGNDVELVMRLIEDGYVLMKSRELLPFVDVRDKEKCPFLNDSTRKSFRRLFGAPKKNGLRLKVWFQYPLYVKYTGALCKYLKKWINATEFIEEDTGNYWKLPVKRVLDAYELDYSVLMGKNTKPPWEHTDTDSSMWWENGGLSTMMFLSPEGPKILARYLDLHVPEYMDKKELEEHRIEQERKEAAKKRDERNIIEFALRKEAEKKNLEKKMEELLISKTPMPSMGVFKGKKPTIPEALNNKAMQVFKLQKVRRDGYESNEDEDLEDPEQFYRKFEIKAELVDKPPPEDCDIPVNIFLDAAEMRKEQRRLRSEGLVDKELFGVDSSKKKPLVIVDEDSEGWDEDLSYVKLREKLSKTGAIPKETSNGSESGSQSQNSKEKLKEAIKLEIDSITNHISTRNMKTMEKLSESDSENDEPSSEKKEKKVRNLTINLGGNGGQQRKVVVTIDKDTLKKDAGGMVWEPPEFVDLLFAQKLLAKMDENDDEDPLVLLAKQIMDIKTDVDYTKNLDLECASKHLHVLSYQSKLKRYPNLRKDISPEQEKLRSKQYRRSVEALQGYGIRAIELARGHVISATAWRCDLFMTEECLDGLVVVKNTKNTTKFSHRTEKTRNRKQRVKAPKNMKKVIREERIKQKKEERMKSVRLKQDIMRKQWEEEKAVVGRRYNSANNIGDETPFMMYKSLLWEVVKGDVRAMRNMITVLTDTRNDDTSVTSLTKEQKQQIEDDKQLIGVLIKKLTEYKDSKPFIAFPSGMEQVTDIYHAVIMAKMLRESLRELETADNAQVLPSRSLILDTFAEMVPHFAEEVKFDSVQRVKKFYEGREKYKSFIERKIIQEAERRVQIEAKEKGEYVTVEDRVNYTKRPEFQDLVYEKLLEGSKNRADSGKEKKKKTKSEKDKKGESSSASEQEQKSNISLDQPEDIKCKSPPRDDGNADSSSKGSSLSEEAKAQVETDVQLFLSRGCPEDSSLESRIFSALDQEKQDEIRKHYRKKALESEKIEAVPSNDDVTKSKKSYAFKSCSHCDKVETSRKQFKQCQRCVAEKSKRIRFYCTKECQVNDWKLKHKEQHATGIFN